MKLSEPALHVEDEHQQILEAVTDGNEDWAVQLLASHYEMTGAFLESYVD